MTNNLSGYEILVAEDNEINAKLIAYILTQAGATVSLVKNGQQTIDCCRNMPFDAILMDIHMPIMNGIQAAQQIRSQEVGSEHVPIIGLTASLLDTDRENYIQAGFDTILVKPADNEQLIALIKELCTQPAALQKVDLQALPPADASTNRSPPIQTSLISMLIKEIPDVRARMQAATDTEDWQQLQEISHKFLGGLGYCDAQGLREATRQLHHCLISEEEHGDIVGALSGVFVEMGRLLAQHKSDGEY